MGGVADSAIECLGTELAVVDKAPLEVSGLQMVMNMHFLLFCNTASLADEMPGKTVFFNILLKHGGIWS